jgi:hypothetical protein
LNAKLFRNFERQDAPPVTATKRKPKPITANPLFPLVTALWFATLLGLGSFATAPALLEGPVLTLGIPAWIPAAAPPLGFTTRIIFAVAMLGVGAVFGYAVGRFLGREKGESPERMRGPGKKAGADATAARQPINATKDLGAPLDAPFTEETNQRRRSLTQIEEPAAIEAPVFLAPPIEQAPVLEEKQDFQLSPTLTPHRAKAKAVDPLGLDLFLEEAGAIEPAPLMTSQPAFAAPRQEFEQADEFAPFNALEAEPDVEAEAGAYRETEAQQAAEEPALAAPDQVRQAFVQPAPVPPAPFLQARTVDATPIDGAPLESLGLVQLVERLALAISRREVRPERIEHTQPKAPELVASAPVMVPARARFETSSDAVLQSEIPDADGPVELVEESAPIPAAYAPEEPERVVQLRPAILQPLQSFDEIEADGDELGDEQEPDAGLERFLRMSPLLARKSDQIAEAFGVTNDGAPEPEVAEDCYPSLLDMAPVVQRREPLRIDDSMYDEEAAIEHAVVFPGQEAPWPVEAARAAAMPTTPIPALPAQTGVATSRPFERPSVVPVPGSPLASPGRAAPSIQASSAQEAGPATQPFAQSFGQSPVQPQAQAPAMPDAEEADRALRAALETLQRMTARG